MKQGILLLIGLLLFQFSQARIIRKRIPDKLIVLTFDDGVKTHFTYVAPLLKKYGFPATFFVCEFQPDFEDTIKYMTWPQIASLAAMGFEIGNHTWHHKHVDKVDSNILREELAYINDQCRKYGIASPVSFAYPGYDTYAPAIKTMQASGIRMARTGGSRPYDPLKDHPFYIPSYSTTGTDTIAIINAMKKAISGKIVVLTIHGVPDIAHPWVSTPPSIFEYYLKFLKANHYKVIAMKDLLEYIDMDEAAAELALPEEYHKP